MKQPHFLPDQWKQIHDSLLATANQMEKRANAYEKAGLSRTTSWCWTALKIRCKRNKCLNMALEIRQTFKF